MKKQAKNDPPYSPLRLCMAGSAGQSSCQCPRCAKAIRLARAITRALRTDSRAVEDGRSITG